MRVRILLIGIAVAMLLVAAPAAAAAPGIERVPVVDIGDPPSRAGTSFMVRADRGVVGVVVTGGLVRGHAYTVWAVVFNNPEACDADCDSADLANPDVGGVSILATGKVVRAPRAAFAIRLVAGDELVDPLGAEIYFVVRTHGPAPRGLVDEQTSSLNGGCPPNDCANVLVAKHQ